MSSRERTRGSLLARAAGVVLASATAVASASAQQARSAPAIAGVEIRVTGEHAALSESGVLTFDRQGLVATVAVVGVDSAGRAVPGARLGRVTWRTSDENVVSLYDHPAAATVRVVAQQDGRAALTVTSGDRTATLPVFVGEARHGIAAGDVSPKFRVARLEVLAEQGNAGPDAEVANGRLRIRTNGHGASLRARAVAADGTPLPLAYFPVRWATADTSVVELTQAGYERSQLVAREPGATTLTATIQGTTATVNVEVVPSDATVGTLSGAQLVAAATGVPTNVAPVATRHGTTAVIAPAARADAPVTRATLVGAAPTGVSAAPSGATGLAVRWTPAPGAAGHVVAWSRSASSGFVDVATVAGSAASAALKGVPPGTTYVRVTATYGDRPNGAAAPVAVAMPPAPQPTNFRAVSGAGYVKLQWDSVPDAAGYTLSRIEGGTPTPLDDHFPARTPSRLVRRTFVDTRGPGGTVGYVLSAVYRAIDGAEFTGDAAAAPRTPATPLPVEAGTEDSARVTGFSSQSNTLYAQYRVVPGIGWVSAVAVDVLGPAGWKQVNAETYTWANPTIRYRAVPGPRTGSIFVDPNIASGCDHTIVFRIRATVSVGGDVAPQQVMGERRSRPTSVTYDDSFSGCHKSP